MIIFNYGEWLGIDSDISNVSECNVEPFKYKCALTDCSITKSALSLLLDGNFDDFGNPILDFIEIDSVVYVAWIEQPCIAFTPYKMLKVPAETLLKLNIIKDVEIPQDFLEYIGITQLTHK